MATSKNVHVAEKDLRRIKYTFRLEFGTRFVDVYIWKDIKGLHKNTNFPVADHAGAYVAFFDRKKTGLFGEIHLLYKMIGAGYVAHEFQHFMFDWLMSNNKWSSQTNEKQARLCEGMICEFWKEYYRLEEVK